MTKGRQAGMADAGMSVAAIRKMQKALRLKLGMLVGIIDADDYDPVEEHINQLNLVRDKLESYSEQLAAQQSDDEDEEELNEQVANTLNICSAIQRIKSIKNRENGTGDKEKKVREDTYLVKLPKLELPKFDGEFSKWRAFSSLFDMTVHKNPKIADTMKFVYLKNHLVGAAAMDVSGLEETEENYKVAMRILKEKYGRTDFARNVYLKNLNEIKGTRSLYDLQGLRQVLESVVKNLTALDNLGVDRKTYAQAVYCKLSQALPTVLVYDVIKKLSKMTVREEGEECDGLSDNVVDNVVGEYPAKLQLIIDVLRERVRICEEYSADAGLNEPSKRWEKEANEKRDRFSKGGKSSPSIVFRASANAVCIFCSGQHASALCSDLKTSAADKRQIVCDKRVCFLCCEQGHFARNCPTEPPRCRKCHVKHLTILHVDRKSARVATPEVQKAVVSKIAAIRCAPYKETAFVYAGYGQSRQIVRLVLDTCSDKTFILKRTADRLRLNCMGEETLQLDTFDSKNIVVRTYKKVVVHLQHLKEDMSLKIEALVTDTIDQTPEAYPQLSDELREKLSEMQCWSADMEQGNTLRPFDLLVGCDYIPLIYKAQVRRLGKTLLARDTIFGWVVIGSEDGRKFGPNITVARVSVLPRSSPENMWSLEAIGIESKELTMDKDAALLADYVKNVQYGNGQYSVAIPVKRAINELNDNFDIAYSRLQKRIAILRRSETAFERYNSELKKFLDSDFTERVPLDEIDSEKLRYFMPHHAVVRESSTTTPVRIVFDCASHGPGRTSLNECVETGPNIHHNMVDLLLRFRENRVGITADVSKAFLRILLHKAHRDLFRYLWVEDDKIVQFRFKTLPFGCNASPYLLTATIQHHLDRQPYSEAIATLKTCFYVDDMVTGRDTIEETQVLKEEAIRTLMEAGMTLGKWASNALELCDETIKEKGTSGVLGYVWHHKNDTFRYRVSTIDDNDILLTKRQLLSITSRLFDPLGLLTPFTCTAKRLFQDTWKESRDWNEKLSDEIVIRFRRWVGQLGAVEQIEIPRWYGDARAADRVELHVFGDYAPGAYATVVYMRMVLPAGIRVVPVIGRQRLTPLNVKITVPRGELLAAVISARIGKYVQQILNVTVQATYFWSDSWIALCWIRSAADRWSPFVANRVAEIRQLTATKQWRHCPGKENPADLATRGISAAELKASKLWWEGPQFLQHTEPMWPDLEPPLFHEDEQALVDAEQRPIRATVRCAAEATDRSLRIERFSRLTTVVNICEKIRRFVSATTRKPGNDNARMCSISGFVVLLRFIQQDTVRKEIEHVLKKQSVPVTSKLRPFQLLVSEEGLLRIKTRLSGDAFTFEEKNPIVLLPDHPGVKLIVGDCHERLMHGGTSSMMADLRRFYYIVNCRSLCRKHVASCVTCTRYRPRTADDLHAPIPTDRLVATRPFERVGVDFFGPILAKEGDGVKKLYVALFTCLVVRAVHLEVVYGLTAQQFIDALRRFIARRRVPEVIYSDNALTFVKSRAEISQLYRNIENEKTRVFLETKAIAWKFSTPLAPWTGGSWERMVKTVKAPLRKVVGRAKLTPEQLQTVILEIEAIVNTRPLVAPTADSEEVPALTPAHFLYGGHEILLPSGQRANLPETFRRREQIMTALWKRFREEYLAYLRNVHANGRRQHSLRTSQVVIVDDTPAPRCMWRLGVVEEVFQGRDGLVRSGLVRMPNGATLRRATRHLIPLEIPGDQCVGPQDVTARDEQTQ